MHIYNNFVTIGIHQLTFYGGRIMNTIPLSIQIDIMKFQLNSLILNNSLTDEVVVYYSQKLDKLIVKYELTKNMDAPRKRAV